MSANWINRLSCRGIMLFHALVCVACPIPVSADHFVDLRAVAATDQELDSMRGGFTYANGLEISFGVEQAVLIDGILQVTNNFSASSINSILPQQIADLSSAKISADAIRTQVNTIIQNSQDQRVIDSITLINATVTTLGLSRELSLLQSLQQQQISARQ